MSDELPINMWLDDDLLHRKPPICGIPWTWVHTADAAIDLLKTGRVVWASLDHDLADEHYIYYHSDLRACHESGRHVIGDDTFATCVNCGLSSDDENWLSPKFREKTGMAVLDYMDEYKILPKHGVRIHTMNPGKKRTMLLVVEKLYGETYQVQYAGTHLI